jgi:hypothetical protein
MEKKFSPSCMTGPKVIFLLFALLFFAVTSYSQSDTKSFKVTSIPDSIHRIFEKSCMSCHSDGGKTLALIHVNFSKWDTYTAEKQASKAADICKEISKGAMPPKSFRESKPDAVPTAEQIKSLCNWSESVKSNTRQ